MGGHTHTRFAEQVGRLTLLNPGTLRRDDVSCFAIVDLSEKTYVVQFYDLDDDGVVRASERVLL